MVAISVMGEKFYTKTDDESKRYKQMTMTQTPDVFVTSTTLFQYLLSVYVKKEVSSHVMTERQRDGESK